MPSGWWRVLDYERDPEAEVTFRDRLATRTRGVVGIQKLSFFKIPGLIT